ncbi:MAG TPA: TetR family transcriptional regulator [Mycobacteriales bacterium]|nr:TetR family transcriptional regulator [Mycobacteriales bacterium]HVX69886.1 TetR family transcriptional regulator [Mycobacteriales bacterium]
MARSETASGTRTDSAGRAKGAKGAPPLRAVDGRVPGRRGLATRKRLVECTIDLLGNTAYRDLKVTDITRAAGTSPATFYQYFVDLESVLLAVAEQAVEEGQRLVDLIAGRQWAGTAGVTSAEALVDGFLDFYRTHRPTLRVVDLLSTEGDRRFRHLRTLILNGMTKALAAEIEKVQGKGSDVDPMAMAGTLIGLLPQMAGHQGGFEAWDIPFAHVREAMIRLIYWGVTGPKVPRR